MSIEVRHKGSITILDISARMLTEKHADEIQAKFNTLLEEGARSFVFDMTGVAESITEPINTVVACRNKVLRREGVLKLVLSERLRGLYTILFLDTIFEIFDDIEEALASFAS